MEAQNAAGSAEKGNMEVSKPILRTKLNFCLPNFVIYLCQEAMHKTSCLFFALNVIKI